MRHLNWFYLIWACRNFRHYRVKTRLMSCDQNGLCDWRNGCWKPRPLDYGRGTWRRLQLLGLGLEAERIGENIDAELQGTTQNKQEAFRKRRHLYVCDLWPKSYIKAKNAGVLRYSIVGLPCTTYKEKVLYLGLRYKVCSLNDFIIMANCLNFINLSLDCGLKTLVKVTVT